MILHKDNKVLRSYGIGSIVLVAMYVLISAVMLVSGVSEANEFNRTYEIDFVRSLEDTGKVYAFGDVYEGTEYSSFMKIYYNENDSSIVDTGNAGLMDSGVSLPEFYYPDMDNWTSIFSMFFVFWMVYSVGVAVFILGKRMFAHALIVQMITVVIWVISGDLVLLSLRGFILFIPLMLLNIYIIKYTRFKDYQEHWFKGIFTYKEPIKLY